MKRTSIGPDGVERLAGISLFADLSHGQRQMIARLADQVIVGAGETIMDPGEPGYEFMVLERGSAEVVRDAQRVSVMGPGDHFGELAVLSDGTGRTARVTALTDVRALVFTAHFMHEMRERIPQLGERIDRTASERRERDAAAHGA
jgi:CRP-like cAMP-binding protein